MDCLQLQPHQLRTQPFHYLINEQAKSLLALQELQNEVGALLEFRDLVMETFPNLRQKMSSASSTSHNFSNNQNYCSNTPVQLSASLNSSRQWEPGIKVKRKIVNNKGEGDGSFGRTRSNSHGSKIHSSQPKSSEAISGVQDSGFSTETNSSNKDHVSSTATSSVPMHVHADDPFLGGRKETASHKDPRRSDYDRSDEDLSEDGMVMKVNEAEEELWNLLDVIHTKGTKLREEVETLQLRLVVEEIENQMREKELGARKSDKRAGRRCRSLDNFAGEGTLGYVEIDSFTHNHDGSFEALLNRKKTRSIEMEDVEHIREERNLLLDKLAEMETENVATRIKNSELQSEITALINTKEELQEQLFQAMKQKNELNSRIHDLHLKFVTGDRRGSVCGGKLGRKSVDKDTSSVMTDSESSQTESSSLSRCKSSDDCSHKSRGKKSVVGSDVSNRRVGLVKFGLGALDGLVTNPRKLKEYCKVARPSRDVLEAILKERNYLELQRHLLISVAENQALNSQLQTSIKSQEDLCEQLDKYKEENDELKFQLEERNIELEGTKAQVRVLERLQQQSKATSAVGSRVSGGNGEVGKAPENFRFLENELLKSKGFSETEINRAKEIFLESRSKKVDKSEVLRVLNRTATSTENSTDNKNSGERPSDTVRNNFDLMGKGNNVIPILALPLPELSSNQSSGTESTQALEISSELEADMARVDKNESLKSDKSPYRRRPSKIPLNIQKSPKIQAQKSLTKSPSGNPSLKKSIGDLTKSSPTTTTVTMTFKKTDGQSSIRSTTRNPNSIRYGSIGRTNSQQSINSQRSQQQAPPSSSRRKTTGDEDKSLTSNGSVAGKTLSLKQTTNFSNIRQRDTLTRKNHAAADVAADATSNRRTLRRSLRDSFRGRNSNESGCGRKDGSVSSARKDSLQQQQQQTKRTISPGVQLNKPADSDTTKVSDSSVAVKEGAKPYATCNVDGAAAAAYQLASDTRMVPIARHDSDTFTSDSLNSPPPPVEEKPSLFREVRRNFHRRIAEKISQNLAGGYRFLSAGSRLFQNFAGEESSDVKPGRRDPEVDVPGQREKQTRDEIQFFDSIDDSLDIDKDDSLLINSCSYYKDPTGQNEGMAEFDSLELDRVGGFQ